MGDWQFFACRATGDLWLDNDVQLSNVGLAWNLSAANTGRALIPSGGGYAGLATDGRPTWGKWDTLLLAEEDNELTWVGVCDTANPTPQGLALTFTSLMGWLYRVPYKDAIQLWRTDVFDVVRLFTTAAKKISNHYPFEVSSNQSQYSVGDLNPGAEPQPPVKLPGQSQDNYEATDAYQQWLIDYDTWSEQKNNQYTVGWWEAPYIGEEIDNLAQETTFDYREEFRWVNKNQRKFEVKLQLSDFFSNRREDVEFVDGINLASLAIPKDDDIPFANEVIALGAGEGAAMLRSSAGQQDGRLYQGQYRSYKSIRSESRLRALAQQDYKRFNNFQPILDTVTVWDVPGVSPVGTLRVGNEVSVKSDNTTPPFKIWCRITGITRDPTSAVAVLQLEPAS